MPPSGPKRYDREYFEKWYRHPRHSINSRADLVRQVSFAVAVTEQVTARPLRSALDVGAGEGRWQPILQELRPGTRYAGVDSSEWAVSKWGRRRNLRLGTVESLAELGLDGPYDLVIAADIFHYLPTATLRAGLKAIVPLIGGVAFLPTFTADDEIEGDHVEFQRRSGATYRKLFKEAGLVPLGMHAWTVKERVGDLAELELAN